MIVREGQLRKILGIGLETSCRGAGISLRDALERSDYARLRSEFRPSDLLPLIRGNRELVEQWIRYSEDKRTSGGWYLIESACTIGRVGGEDPLPFASIELAVAEYVVQELDFWSAK